MAKSDSVHTMPRQALRLETAWKSECCTTKLNTYNPKYQAAYEEFVLKKSSSSDYSGFFKAKQPFYSAISLAHNLQNLNIYTRFEVWCNTYVDYLDTRYNPHTCVAQMHAITVMIVNGQKKFISKEKMGYIVFEALKACVDSLVLLRMI